MLMNMTARLTDSIQRVVPCPNEVKVMAGYWSMVVRGTVRLWIRYKNRIRFGSELYAGLRKSRVYGACLRAK